MAKKIDPTKNVLDLVAAGAKAQEQLREADNRYQDAMRAAQDRLQNELRSAEVRRLDNLREQSDMHKAALEQQKIRFQTIIDEMRRHSLEKESMLLAKAHWETKSDLSERMAKQEQFRWETGGRSGGRGDVVGWIFGAAGFVAAIASFYINKN